MFLLILIYLRISKGSVVRLKLFGVNFIDDHFNCVAGIDDDYLGLINTDW